MQLNDLLVARGIDPGRTLVMRHRPSEPGLCEVLPWFAAERPEVFKAYQQTHQNPNTETAMGRAGYLASFFGHQPGEAMFVGLYRLCGTKPMSYDQYWQVPAYQEMRNFGMQGFVGQRPSITWFDMELTEIYAEWKGKLIVAWPGGERSWWRWAERNEVRIRAILDESALDRAMPSWEDLVLSWEQLGVLPGRWRAALSEWRGVYYVLDASDGKGYVGAAYGRDNLLSRWSSYAETGHGGNKLLRARQPRNLRFSILQRVSPDADPATTVRLEAAWKARLHTREHGLNTN